MIKKLFLLLLFLFLAACTVNPPKQSNVENEIDQALASGVLSNQRLADKTATLPAAVNRALLPAVVLSGDSEEKAKAPEPRFDIAVNNVSARTFFIGLVKGTPYNITVSPEVNGNITLDLKHVTVTEVLEAVHDIYGYDYENTPYGYRILPSKLETRIYTVNYLNIDRSGKSNTTISSGQITRTIHGGNSRLNTLQQDLAPSSSIETESHADFWKQLKETMVSIVGTEGGRSVVINPQSGMVIVRAYADEQQKVAEYLDGMQNIMERQVIIEAKVLEIALDAEYQAGIDWNILGIRQTGNRAINDNLDLSENSFKNIFAIKAESGAGFSALIKLLSTQGRVSVLSSPRIATLNNQKAVIKVGEDEFFVTNVSSSTALSSGSATETSQDIDLTPFFSGIALDVTPQIDESGDVILHIHPIISVVKEQEKDFIVGDKKQNLPLAKSSIRESDNVVRAQDGQMVVIGGLMESGSYDYQAKTPGGDKVPLVNGLLKDTNRSAKKFELVILLKPTVVNSNTWTKKLQETKRAFANRPSDFEYELDRKYGSISKTVGN